MKITKEFLYEQYNKINWGKQEETKVNSQVMEFITDYTLAKHQDTNISLFDIGFGVGFFLDCLRNGQGHNTTPFILKDASRRLIVINILRTHL